MRACLLAIWLLSAPALAATTSALVHLSPSDVAGGPPAARPPLPALPGFAGPGACDGPGSGCTRRILADDPDPGAGCGPPGSACP